MKQRPKTDKGATNHRGQLCTQAGYLPVPLRTVPLEILADLSIFLLQNDEYSLYRSIGLHIESKDVQRLLDSGVEYVYISVKDHQAYYRTIEATIQQIVKDPHLQTEKKTQILYATSIELANQLLSAPPKQEDIRRARGITRATVQLILEDPKAFGYLFETFNHDFYTATHMVNVCGLAVALALQLGWQDEDALHNLGIGCLLHDIGKIFIPNDILNAETPLTADQLALVRDHVKRGEDHLRSLADLPEDVLSVVAEHHERLDGSGYPRRLRTGKITTSGRLAGIVDTFDAMTSVRPYRPMTYSVEQTLEYLQQYAGQEFDPEIVQAFTDLIEKNFDQPETALTDPDRAIKMAAGGSDRWNRRRKQFYFRIPITVQRIVPVRGKPTLGPPESMIGHKISSSGMGFLSAKPFALDQNIYITAAKLIEAQMNPLLAVVTACRDHGDGWYSIDSQFHSVQTPEAMCRLQETIHLREVCEID
ncbi:MAG: HD domain-containing protein [Sedimentisphaerales bacterium]|nr:HD domain-containing protein [Sedimentisphaerales bacterium]